MINTATHNGIFHADEVTAIALLMIFLDDEIVVNRIAHDTKDFSSFDMVIDISKRFDDKKYFDHHQYKGGKSSAGLIWSYLGFEDEYPKLSKLIKLVDDNDTGVKKAKDFEYSSLIKAFNHKEIHSDAQTSNFYQAIDFAMTILNSLADAQEDINEAKSIVASSFHFDGNRHIIELSQFTPHWTTYINGIATPHIKAVVWQDTEENNWKVKITPKKIGSFELTTTPFQQDSSMEFVHSAGHFAIAKDEETLKHFLSRNNI